MAARRKRVLGSLLSLTFDVDPLVQWRAIEGMGAAAQRIAEDDPDVVREHLRRLFWLISEESGGVCWHAPEAMAEIVAQTPEPFADYVPVIISLIRELADEDLEHFRAGAIWAIGRLGGLAAGHVADSLPAITAALDDPGPQVRGVAAWCLGRIGHATVLRDRPQLQCDDGAVKLYEGGRLERLTVRRIVHRAIDGG